MDSNPQILGLKDYRYQYKPSYQQPLDFRTRFDSLTDAQNFINVYGDICVYSGLLMSIGTGSDVKLYIVKSETKDNQTIFKLEEVGAKNIENPSLFIYSGGNTLVTELTTADESQVGKVYNIKKSFTIQEPKLDTNNLPVVKYNQTDKMYYVETETNAYPAGTNVICYKLEWTHPSPRRDKDGNIIYKLDENSGQKIPVYDEKGNPIENEYEMEMETVTEIEYRWDALGGMYGIDWIPVNS